MNLMTNRNDFYKFIILGCGLNLLFTLPIYTSSDILSNDLVNVFLYQYGDLSMADSSFMFSLIIYMINKFILIINLGNSFSNDLSVYGPYIFTRTKKRSNLIYKKSFSVLIYCLIYLIFQFLFTFILGIIFNLQINNEREFFTIILALFCINITSIYLLVLQCNMLSMILDFKYCYIIILFSEILILSLFQYTNLISTNIIKYFPSFQGIFTWHETNLINSNSRNIFDFFINNFSINDSYIYNILLILITILISKIIINKINIL